MRCECLKCGEILGKNLVHPAYCGPCCWLLNLAGALTPPAATMLKLGLPPNNKYDAKQAAEPIPIWRNPATWFEVE